VEISDTDNGFRLYVVQKTQVVPARITVGVTMSKYVAEIDKLERFNNRVREMMESSFVHFLNEKMMTLRIREGLDESMVAEAEMPDKESIKAFVPDFRLVYKRSKRYDKFSLEHLHDLYGKLDIPELLKKKFDETYTMLNEYLNNPIGMTVNNETPTNKELLDGFIFGDYLHETQRKKYQRWTKTDLTAQILRFIFCSTLSLVLNMIATIAGINSDVIEILESRQTRDDAP
jgi:hypothetical protein